MIGIYGGTFNPVHYGHLRTANEVKALFGLDDLRLLPCYQPAHRDCPQVSAAMRLKMLSLAVCEFPELSIDKRELERQGISYMVDTLASLRKENTNTPLILFIGLDAFQGLQGWQRWQNLFDYAHIVVMTRPHFEQEKLAEFYLNRLVNNRQSLKDHSNGKIYFQQVMAVDISATLIREKCLNNESLSDLLPENVIKYIQTQHLYRV